MPLVPQARHLGFILDFLSHFSSSYHIIMHVRKYVTIPSKYVWNLTIFYTLLPGYLEPPWSLLLSLPGSCFSRSIHSPNHSQGGLRSDHGIPLLKPGGGSPFHLE
jgi:hypothetical protein